MVVINMEIPKGCQHCKFFRKHAFGNGLDYSYSCDLGATDFPMPWIRQMEERANDCPLIEIEERKVGKWIYNNGSYKCPFCSHEVIGLEQDLKFCVLCGAEMRGAE